MIRPRYAAAWIKALFAYAVVERFGVGNRVDSWRWRLLPSYGDWIFRDDEQGRLSSLGRFVELRDWRQKLAREDESVLPLSSAGRVV